MKSVGHTAYDAFRKEVPWLPCWEVLTDEQRQRWNDLANDTLNAHAI